MQEPTRWSQAMGYYDALANRAQELLGENPHTAQEYSWQFDPEARHGIKGSDGHSHDLSAVLGDGADSDNEAHAELFFPGSQHCSEPTARSKCVPHCLRCPWCGTNNVGTIPKISSAKVGLGRGDGPISGGDRVL